MHDLATELREARLAAGISQDHVGRVAGLNQSMISRVERGRVASAGVDVLARHCAALGLRLSLRVYPDGDAVRDAAQLRLLGRLRAEVHGSYGWRTEVPVAGAGICEPGTQC